MAIAARHRRFSPAVFALLLAALLAGPADATEMLEDAVKATYLYKFAPFVEWPAAAFASAPDTFNLCVISQGPVGELIERAVSGQRLGARAMTVRHLETVAADSACHILYIANPDAAPSAAILASLRGTPVLTVTNAARDGRSKGIINFVTQDNRVRFEIDNRAASENGLAVSSKLLSLAIEVKP